MTDAEAVRLLQQGDRRGPEALLAQYQMLVYNLALRMLDNAADAEDATQDVFLRAFQRLGQYRPDEAFGAWLAGITRHHCIDMLRRRRPPLHGTPSATPDAERVALERLEHAEVRAALGRLPARDRALLVLRYWEDQPVERIARVMHMSPGAVRVGLLRARRALAGALRAQGMEVGDAL